MREAWLMTTYVNPCKGCAAKELYIKEGRKGRPPWPNGQRDEDGYPLCGFCGKHEIILGPFDRVNLTQCPDCNRWFKGYKMFPKFNLSCSECE